MTSHPDDGPTWTKQIDKKGEFRRKEAGFRQTISDEGAFAPESGRYHLYVSYACPWAHRTLITRLLKGLEHAISFDVVDHFLPHEGWTLEAKSPGATRDTVNGKRTLREIYQMVEPEYRGSVTVPTLWDKKTSTIVNNESSEIIRIFNSAFQQSAKNPTVDLYPEECRAEIDQVNDWVYPMINNGVYRCGFARSQEAYDHAVRELFEGLDRAEEILSRQRFLAGKRLTEADVRLFTTLIRFDLVYATHFKCSLRRVIDYPHLWGYTRELYSYPAFRSTTNFEHIKQHYFASHETINPFGIVPFGPELDLDAPHGRESFPATFVPDVE